MDELTIDERERVPAERRLRPTDASGGRMLRHGSAMVVRRPGGRFLVGARGRSSALPVLRSWGKTMLAGIVAVLASWLLLSVPVWALGSETLGNMLFWLALVALAAVPLVAFARAFVTGWVRVSPELVRTVDDVEIPRAEILTFETGTATTTEHGVPHQTTTVEGVVYAVLRGDSRVVAYRSPSQTAAREVAEALDELLTSSVS